MTEPPVHFFISHWHRWEKNKKKRRSETGRKPQSRDFRGGISVSLTKVGILPTAPTSERGKKTISYWKKIKNLLISKIDLLTILVAIGLVQLNSVSYIKTYIPNSTQVDLI